MCVALVKWVNYFFCRSRVELMIERKRDEARVRFSEQVGRSQVAADIKIGTGNYLFVPLLFAFSPKNTMKGALAATRCTHRNSDARWPSKICSPLGTWEVAWQGWK